MRNPSIEIYPLPRGELQFRVGKTKPHESFYAEQGNLPLYPVGRDLAAGRNNQAYGLEAVGLHDRCRACVVKLASKRPKIDDLSRTRMMHCHSALPFLRS